jgi:hypothetical protein
MPWVGLRADPGSDSDDIDGAGEGEKGEVDCLSGQRRRRGRSAVPARFVLERLEEAGRP